MFLYALQTTEHGIEREREGWREEERERERKRDKYVWSRSKVDTGTNYASQQTNEPFPYFISSTNALASCSDTWFVHLTPTHHLYTNKMVGKY